MLEVLEHGYKSMALALQVASRQGDNAVHSNGLSVDDCCKNPNVRVAREICRRQSCEWKLMFQSVGARRTPHSQATTTVRTIAATSSMRPSSANPRMKIRGGALQCSQTMARIYVSKGRYVCNTHPTSVMDAIPTSTARTHPGRVYLSVRRALGRAVLKYMSRTRSRLHNRRQEHAERILKCAALSRSNFTRRFYC